MQLGPKPTLLPAVIAPILGARRRAGEAQNERTTYAVAASRGQGAWAPEPRRTLARGKVSCANMWKPRQQPGLWFHGGLNTGIGTAGPGP